MKITRFALASLAAGFMATAAYADVTYNISIDTSSLLSASSAPYSLDFQLNGNDNVSNNATLSGFTFLGTGAAALGSATTTGTASGDMRSTIILSTGANVFNDIYQGFTAGTTNISFMLTLGALIDFSTPDAFSIGILDNTTNNIATTAGDGISLATITIDSNSPTIGAYTGISPTTVSATVSPVPEPSTYLLFGLGALVLVVAFRRRAA